LAAKGTLETLVALSIFPVLVSFIMLTDGNYHRENFPLLEAFAMIGLVSRNQAKAGCGGPRSRANASEGFLLLDLLYTE
jgi:hypothetical protein